LTVSHRLCGRDNEGMDGRKSGLIHIAHGGVLGTSFGVTLGSIRCEKIWVLAKCVVERASKKCKHLMARD
jgi:hypothetical protein